MVALLTFWPGLLVAQQVTPSDGIRLPDASIATQGDAASLEVNPAGLAFMRGAELGYGFELAAEDLRGVADEAQSYFLAGGLGFLGAGLSAQWLQKPNLGGDLQSYRKFTLGSGVALSRLGVGMGLNFFGSSDDERLDGLLGVDLGFQLRSSEHFGLGLVLRDVNAPFVREDLAVPARIELAAALRFWDGRLVLEQWAQTNLRDRYVTLTPRLSLEPIRGLRAFGRTEISLTRVGDVFDWSWDGLFAGLELSLGSIGAAYAAMTRRYEANEDPRFSGISAYHWISPGKKAPLVAPTKRWIWINLDVPISEEPVSGLFVRNTRGFLSIARELERLETAEDVDGVVFGVSETGLGYAQLWELRNSVRRLHDSGKKTIAILGDSSLRQYYFASAADEVWYVPTDVFTPSGLRSRFLSVRGTLDKLDIEAQFVRIGEYKSTPEMLLYDEPTPQNVEQREEYVDALWAQIISDIATSRGKSEEEIRRLLTKTHLPDEAKKLGLVDELVYADEAERILRERDSNISLEAGYPESVYPEQRWGRGPEIAVVAVEGNIVKGESTSTPLLGDAVAGSDTLAKTLERLRTDPQVKAVVIRIDSAGGSAVASDLIYRSIRNVARHKPVIASMGNIAASGGYYVAAGADTIYATPNTTTGSIGIFAGKVNIARLAERIGIHTQSVERGRPTSFSDFYQPWSDEELEDIGTSLNYMYRLFLTQAAHTRPLSLEELDAVARGRIWTGRPAEQLKLVDKIGGLMAAIHRAEELAGLERGEAEYRQYASTSGFGLNLEDSVLAERLGLDRRSTANELLNPSTMIGRFLRQTSQAWEVPLLYDAGEPLMLPFETVAVE